MPLLTRRMLVPLPSLLLLPRGKVTRTLAEMLRGINLELMDLTQMSGTLGQLHPVLLLG